MSAIFSLQTLFSWKTFAACWRLDGAGISCLYISTSINFMESTSIQSFWFSQ